MVRKRSIEELPRFENLELRLLLDGGLLYQGVPMDTPPAENLFVACDSNFDNKVDGADLALWQQNYDPLGSNNNTYFDGDWNLDGTVGGADLARWQQNYSALGTTFTGEYAWFNEFSIENFGGESEDLVYETFGLALVFVEDNAWSHVSVNSASIAFETNIPARVYVNYGETTEYGRMTMLSEREFYVHVNYLQGLDADTTYHYRLVAMDERGNVITSGDRTFTTSTIGGWTQLSGHLSIPYDLNQAGQTYILTSDIVADSTAFNIRASNVTLDLNGYTIIYDNLPGAIDPTADQGSYGYFAVQGPHAMRTAYNKTGIKVYNGYILQGDGGSGYLADPIYARGSQEYAGVTLYYHGTQMNGFYGSLGDGHHNVVVDRGTVITNRHSGIDGFNGSTSNLHHNLVKRVRHRGIRGQSNQQLHENEIYVDSWDTNSFAIMFYANTNSHAYGNRIFGTGYLVIGIGTVSNGVANIEINDNFIHLQATAPVSRSAEYGPQSGAYATRVTWGGENLNYHDNVMTVYARDGGMVRGVWMCPENDIINNVFRDNIIKAIAENPQSNTHGAIVIDGTDTPDAAPTLFIGNTVISNFANVTLAEPYGSSNNQIFRENTFVRVGNRANYRTIEIGYWNKGSYGHRFIDNEFEGGASYDLVLFEGTGIRNFTVEWTLTVNTTPLADVVIEDFPGSVVFSGQADGSGVVSVELVQYLEEESGRTYHTDHTVTVSKAGQEASTTVTMDHEQTITLEVPTEVMALGVLMPLGETALPDGSLPGFYSVGPPDEFFLADANGDGFVDGGDLSIWQRNYDPLGYNENTYATGDFSGDGLIDGTDLAMWQLYYLPLNAGGDDGIGFTTFTTREPLPGEIPISSGPYLITSPGYYILTANITAEASAIGIASGNVTLDLNGYTVTWGTGYTYSPGVITYNSWQSGNVGHSGILSPSRPDKTDDFPGTFGWNPSRPNVVIKNGRVKQARGIDLKYCVGVNVSGIQDLVMHDLLIEVDAPDTEGVQLGRDAEMYNVTVVHDGTVVTNRHQQLGVIVTGTGDEIHHVEVEGGPQMAIKGNDNAIIHSNLLRHRVTTTNGYGVAGYSKDYIQVYNNYIMPYNGRGIHLSEHSVGWDVHDNYVEVRESADFNDEYSILQTHGIKFENTTQSRAYNNVVLSVSSSHGQPTALNMDMPTNSGNSAYNNTFIALTINSEPAWSIYLIGSDGQSAEVNDNVFYTNDISLQASWNGGVNHTFRRSEFRKVNPTDDNLFIKFYNGGGNPAENIRFIDCVYRDGIDPRDYWVPGASTSWRSDLGYAFGWSLELNVTDGGSVLAGADVVITDSFGATVATGQTDGSGQFTADLLEFEMTWARGDSSLTEIEYGAYTVTITEGGRERVLTVNAVAPMSVQVDITGSGMLMLTPEEPIDGEVGEYYSLKLSATGTDVASWSVISGLLPTGLSITDGVITGTPTTAGEYTFTVKADRGGAQATRELTIVIVEEPVTPFWRERVELALV